MASSLSWRAFFRSSCHRHFLEVEEEEADGGWLGDRPREEDLVRWCWSCSGGWSRDGGGPLEVLATGDRSTRGRSSEVGGGEKSQGGVPDREESPMSELDGRWQKPRATAR